MSSIPTKPIRTIACSVALSLLAASIMAFAQDQAGSAPPSSAPNPGWNHFSNPPSNDPPPNDSPGQTVPSRLTLQAGTFLTVRVDQMLSSDKNQANDGFAATLVRPLVADGVVIAQRGQMLGGRVAEAEKAGRVKGVSRLAVQLTGLTLVDGQQVPIQTELTSITGPTSKGRDAAGIMTTTATGAAIGAAADWGVGAAIGAGAGLIAGTVGVLVTRGRPTVIYPESVLTFQLAQPITISTDRAPQAFGYVGTMGYNQTSAAQGQASPPPSGWNCGGYGYPPPPPSGYGYPPPPPYAYYPYYWGPSFAFWFGPGFGYGRGFYGRGFGYRR
jgi:hypothetical protein